jgi:hypothetical protein
MTEKQRLLDCFSSGQLIRPAYDGPTFVDLVSALALLCHGQAREPGPGTDQLVKLIGPADHYVVILVDGMGMDQLTLLPADSFLRRSVALQLQAVFLSTTACALTTFGTGVWPATHSIPGWWTYLPDQDQNLVTLYFTERASGKPLTELGVSVPDVFPQPSIWGELTISKLQILPAHIAQSVYTGYSSGEADRVGYEHLEEALTRTRARTGGPAPAALGFPAGGPGSRPVRKGPGGDMC